MEKAELIKVLQEKKEIKERLEISFHQVIGQIALLEELIKKDEVKKE